MKPLNLKRQKEEANERYMEEPQYEVPVPDVQAELPEIQRRTWSPYLIGAIAFAAALTVAIAFLVAPSGWRAVFLTNNQVYFGKFRSVPFSNSIVLRDIYYLQVTPALQPQTEGVSAPAIKVVKLGSELHGPADEMHIPRSQILFWEKLKSDSPVVRAISQTSAR
jgi:hypothetical protein